MSQSLCKMLAMRRAELSDTLRQLIHAFDFSSLHEHLDPLKKATTDAQKQQLAEIWSLVTKSIDEKVSFAKAHICDGPQVAQAIQQLEKAGDFIGKDLKNRSGTGV